MLLQIADVASVSRVCVDRFSAPPSGGRMSTIVIAMALVTCVLFGASRPDSEGDDAEDRSGM